MNVLMRTTLLAYIVISVTSGTEVMDPSSQRWLGTNTVHFQSAGTN